MKNILLLLLFPLMMLAQDTTLVGDVDCDGEVNSQDASLILQFVTNVINDLPCQENMTGLTPEQLQEIINMMDEQLSVSYNVSGHSNYPIMISSISSETMTWGDALIYCADLEEDGRHDWFLPNVDQLAYAVGGGCELPDERAQTALWTTSKAHSFYDEIIILQESGQYGLNATSGDNEMHCRCVRFGEGETGEGSGSSSSSGSAVAGETEQPITMIGPMYIYEEYPDFITNSAQGDNYLNFIDANRFCKELIYDEYDDWYLPSILQLINYNILNNSIVLPNYSNQAYEDYYWSSSQSLDSYTYYYFYIADGTFEQVYDYTLSSISSPRRCFCVR